jgi:molybdopterin converting factor subunit 1
MHITVRLFARLRELAGASEVRRTLPDGSNVRAAWDSLVGEFPGFDDYSRAVSCAVNEEYARMTTPLADGDEVAFLPPVSGG